MHLIALTEHWQCSCARALASEALTGQISRSSAELPAKLASEAELLWREGLLLCSRRALDDAGLAFAACPFCRPAFTCCQRKPSPRPPAKLKNRQVTCQQDLHDQHPGRRLPHGAP
mmetsp:Transcript_70111/g.185129  ORF Transcript_70111/g.185129 Transcript_70111/m.185129 type:complete len:116 (-) Transcript_70111:68-415(-)